MEPHFPVLAAAVHRTQGPILEMGAGHFSTPMLSLMCKEPKRRLVTVESDKEWLDVFKDNASDSHELYHVLAGEEDAFKLIDEVYWDVVFIDHRPGDRRRDEIIRLRENALYIVVHDSQADCYKYEPVFAQFTYRVDWKVYETWTTVVSMKKKFEI